MHVKPLELVGRYGTPNTETDERATTDLVATVHSYDTGMGSVSIDVFKSRDVEDRGGAVLAVASDFRETSGFSLHSVDHGTTIELHQAGDIEAQATLRCLVVAALLALDKVADAVQHAKSSGIGIVLPARSDEPPELSVPAASRNNATVTLSDDWTP